MPPDAERPRERLLVHGPEILAVEELLAIVLGTGMPGASATELARRLLVAVGGLDLLARAPAQELVGVAGIGAARAARLCAAFALGRRGIEARTASASIQSAADVYARLRPRTAGLAQEVFLVLGLDVRNAVMAEIEIARGCLTGVEVHPREVFRPLIRAGAAACIVAHNHPSGDPTPSRDDLLLTARLREVGELVGIPVLDHVIVATRGYVSVAERYGMTPAD
ncbi:MAG TPA: DNA repair protein RadC [Kofleriaceae bacterium]|nr:DNA repair protein RadC [Kofleriaceae bacterium]